VGKPADIYIARQDGKIKIAFANQSKTSVLTINKIQP
jgi:hypothetical protein